MKLVNAVLLIVAALLVGYVIFGHPDFRDEFRALLAAATLTIIGTRGLQP